MEAVDGWHLKVREGGRETELAVEKSSLRLRRVDARSQPEGKVCKKGERIYVKLLREGISLHQNSNF